MQTQADTGVGVGLIVFSDSKDSTHSNGPYPGSTDVPINFVGAAQVSLLDNRLSGGPQGGTPTGTALQGGYGELASYIPLTPIPPGGQKVLVLITDGVPTDNCAQNGGSYTSNACVQEAAQELTAAAPQGPVLTFVIGTGVFPSTNLSNFDPSFLGNLAEAGGTGPKGCNPNENTTSTDLCYFEVDPTAGSATQTEQAFEAAINAIRGQVLTCTFPLNMNTEAGTLDPSKVNVTVDGTTVPQSSTNGWSYNDPDEPDADHLQRGGLYEPEERSQRERPDRARLRDPHRAVGPRPRAATAPLPRPEIAARGVVGERGVASFARRPATPRVPRPRRARRILPARRRIAAGREANVLQRLAMNSPPWFACPCPRGESIRVNGERHRRWSASSFGARRMVRAAGRMMRTTIRLMGLRVRHIRDSLRQ